MMKTGRCKQVYIPSYRENETVYSAEEEEDNRCLFGVKKLLVFRG